MIKLLMIMLRAVLHILFSGFFYGIMIALPIGPANIELIRRGMSEGLLPAMKVGAGIALSDALLCLLAYFGIVKFLMASKIINTMLWLFCAAIMIFFGLSSFTEIVEERSQVMKYIDRPASKRDPLKMGFFINISNPMVIGFWIVFLGTVNSGGLFREIPRTGIFVFAFAVLFGSLAWFYLLCRLVNKGKKYINKNVFQLISFFCATMFTGFGLILIYVAFKTLFF